MKRILRVVLSKAFGFALVILLQVALLLVLVNWLASIGVYAYALYTFVSVVVLLAVLEKDDLNPAYKLMWVVLILLLPAFGALFYLLWGHRTVPRKKRLRLGEIDARADAALAQQPEPMKALEAEDRALAQSARYLAACAHAPLYPVRHAEYYPLGEDFFARYLEAIRGAKKYIFMQYYIWEDGLMLDAAAEILCQKAAEGVDVRLIWDGFGSLFTLRPEYIRRLREAGIRCYPFAPVEFTFHMTDYAMLNHRDHRKITVVDGEAAFTGGVNFADEYINVKERFGLWKDTAFMVTGEAAAALANTFLRAWDYVSGDATDFAAYGVPALPAAPAGLGQGYVQPYWDTPLDTENVSENAYLNIIRHAKDYVYISTPYLIVDHEMITSLVLAAKSGVDVRILTPGIPDKRLVFLVTQSYYPVLLAGGVRIYEYSPGFNHAKMYVSDDKAAIIGSANMDYRSLYLHFENCAAFYGGAVVAAAKADMEACFAASRELTLADTRHVPFGRRMMQILAKFFSPLL